MQQTAAPLCGTRTSAGLRTSIKCVLSQLSCAPSESFVPSAPLTCRTNDSCGTRVTHRLTFSFNSAYATRHERDKSNGMSGIIAILLEFIECLIHQLLHLRKLYSADLFERQRLYGIAVHRSRHPELNDYISTVVESLQVHSAYVRHIAHGPPLPACQARHACCECSMHAVNATDRSSSSHSAQIGTEHIIS